MKIFIFSLSCTFLLSCVTVAASKQTQSGQNADHAPGIAMINTGTDKTTLNALRRKVQKLEDTPALQTKPHQLQCGNTQYTNFQAM
ncbi:MAG: hypothetical protein P4L31_02850, partial [Candidatus Babeliales bacterium]|nr:hypothetical protein [Candidatus Babeliales bacterium]